MLQLGIPQKGDAGATELRSAPLHGDSIINHVRVEQASIRGAINAVVSDMDVSARMALLGLGIEDGTAEVHVDLTMQITPSSLADVVAKVRNGTIGSLLSFTVNQDNAQVHLPVTAVSALPGFVAGAGKQINILWPDVLTGASQF